MLLLTGVSLGFCRSPRQYFYILKQCRKEWKDIERHQLSRLIKEFYKERLVEYKEEKDGSVTIVLTEDGRKKALNYQIDEIEIKKPDKWDNQWRIVIFDIPERRRNAREALRGKLEELGFKKFQKSVFAHPFECEDEINFIVEFFKVRPYVRFMRAASITNEAELKRHFHLY